MIEFENVSFCYGNNSKNKGVKNLNFKISQGELVVICGESGCGKTTLVRLLNGLIPQYYEGNLTGEVRINDESICDKELYDLAKNIGSVFQNPKSQFFTLDTRSEIVFGCENLGFPKEEVIKRLNRVIKEFSIERLSDRSLFHLSGGEKQKIACASVSAVFPEIMLLDEPSSNLDIDSIYDLKKIISFWKNTGKTIVVSEHRLHYLMDIADRVIYMKNGEIYYDLPIDKFKAMKEKEIEELGLRPLEPNKIRVEIHNKKSKGKMIISGFFYKYKHSDKPVLDVKHLELPDNEIIGLVGYNGAGKSTFARCLCGLEKNMEGTLEFKGKNYTNKKRLNLSYMVFQDVNQQLFTESVLDELLVSIKGETLKDKDRISEDILKELDLFEKKDVHPMSLSGGEKQRLVIGSALASNKDIILFDEPTSGLDYRHMLEVSQSFKELKNKGKTIFLISHDVELIYKTCDYIIFMDKGKVLWDRPMDEVGSNLLKRFFSEK